MFGKIIRNQRGSGATGVVILSMLGSMVLIALVSLDVFYVTSLYNHIKLQQDLANRAVYAAIDLNELADRNLRVDDVKGRQYFEEYLKKNLELDSSFSPLVNRGFGQIVVKELIIYNQEDLPGVTPTGRTVGLISVYSELEVEVEPILLGLFGSVKLNPYMTTDLPDVLVKTFHPN